MPRRRCLLSAASSDVLEGCCLRKEPARLAAQAILDQTGERFSKRTISRWMAEWRARRARVSALRNLGIAVAAMHGDGQALQSFSGLFASGSHPPRADELVRSVQSFIRRPTPQAMAEVVLSCLVYQIEVASRQSRKRRHE